MSELASARIGASVLMNLGCGPRGSSQLPPYFSSWRQVRVDIDPSVDPDVLASITDLSAIPSESADAIWTSHCIEHLFAHEVATALAEIRRVLRSDGFACILVPDLQTVANYVSADRLHEVIYQSSAGPVTPHDVVFGFGPAIEGGRPSMAHRCGFTPTVLMQRLQGANFSDIVLRRRGPSLELAAVARKTPWSGPEECQSLLTALGL